MCHSGVPLSRLVITWPIEALVGADQLGGEEVFRIRGIPVALVLVLLAVFLTGCGFEEGTSAESSNPERETFSEYANNAALTFALSMMIDAVNDNDWLSAEPWSQTFGAGAGSAASKWYNAGATLAMAKPSPTLAADADRFSAATAAMYERYQKLESISEGWQAELAGAQEVTPDPDADYPSLSYAEQCEKWIPLLEQDAREWAEALYAWSQKLASENERLQADAPGELAQKIMDLHDTFEAGGE